MQFFYEDDGSDTLIAQINSNKVFHVATKLGIGSGQGDPSESFAVNGDTKISGDLAIGDNVSVDHSGREVTATSFVGDGSQLTNVPVYWYMTPSDSNPAMQLVLNNDGLVGIGAVTSDIQASLHIGEDNTNVPQLRLDDTKTTLYNDDLIDSFDLTFHDNYTDASKKIIEFSRKKEATISPLLSIQANGNVGIGKDPNGYKLDVNGALKAGSFTGSGGGLTDVQLDTTQTNQVTFNATVVIEKAILLNPSDQNPCNNNLGKLFTVNDNADAVALCFCSSNNTFHTIVGSSADVCTTAFSDNN